VNNVPPVGPMPTQHIQQFPVSAEMVAGALRPTRFMVGWLTEAEAVTQLLGRAPTPLDDLREANAAVARGRTAIQLRSAFIPSDPVIEGNRGLLDSVAARPEVHADFPDVLWRVEMVDLTRVQAIQTMVFVDELLPETGAYDAQALVSTCLPVSQPAPPMAMSSDNDGFTMSSVSPNLRIISGQVHPTLAAAAPHLPPRQVQAVTFLVDTPTSSVQVAHYQGRFFLRDGYHRAAGLIRAGVTQVPAVVIDAPSYQFVAPRPGMFDYQVAFSERPPLVTDFWDGSAAADGWQPRTHTAIRVNATQFPVPIYT
jgi:hypothetical protein